VHRLAPQFSIGASAGHLQLGTYRSAAHQKQSRNSANLMGAYKFSLLEFDRTGYGSKPAFGTAPARSLRVKS